MRKMWVMLCIIAGTASFQLFHSCRHELPVDHCATDPVSLQLAVKDAVGKNTNGSITATATGGSGFVFSVNGSPFQDTGYFPGLRAAAYNVVVRNSWGCTDSASVTVNATDPCAGVTISISATKTDASPGTANGSITASATGGSGFTYSINGTSFQSSGMFTKLAAGNYTVTAKNADGCTGTKQVTIGTNDPCAGVTVTVSATKTDPAAGQSNGSITATASGGSGFTYSLNGGAFQSSGTFSNLATGNYTVTAKNSNGCTGTTQVALGTSNPCAGVTITVNITKQDPSLNLSNGSITATAGGSTGFTYSLNGGTYQSSGTFSNLGAGTYTVTAKNANGCIGTGQVTLTGTNPCANINISINATVTDVVPCSSPANNGQIIIAASGSSGYTYNLNGAAYQSTNIFANLAAGTYTMGVKDANGCTNTKSVTVATASSGPLFSAVRTLITNRCSGSGCHMNGGTGGGYNFDNDCSIISNWSKINSSAVTGNNMPKLPQPTLTTAEKKTITDWINAGHTYQK